MENSFLMLFLHYHVPEYPNPRWPPDAILKIQHFDYLSQNVVQYVRFSSMENSFLILFLYYDVPGNIQIQDGHQTPSWKSTFLNIYHRMLCNMTFKGFSRIQNPILMLFLSFKAGPVTAVCSSSSLLACRNSQVELPSRHILSQVVSYF